MNVPQPNQAESMLSRRNALCQYMVKLEEHAKTLEDYRLQVMQRMEDLKDRIKKLAHQEALLQKRKKELQTEAQVVGNERTSYMQNRATLEKNRTATIEELAQLDAHLQQLGVGMQPPVQQEEKNNASESLFHVAHTSPDGSRIAPRIAAAIDIGLTSKHNFFTGLTENLSEGGLFVATYDILPIGTEVQLDMNLPELKPIRVKAVVRWLRDDDSLGANQAPGMGLQFCELDGESKETIRQFLQIRDPIFFDMD